LLVWNWFDREFLQNRSFQIALFWVNLLGTVYGYVWYWDQLVYTVQHKPEWLVLFVPDSPTASLWFTVSLGVLLFAPEAIPSRLIGFVAALGTISSIKYGIWAVVMNFAVMVQGQPLVWEEWMLIVSHLGMAVEALLFVRFFQIRLPHFIFSALLLFLNDWLDYNTGIYPWLRKILEDDLSAIETFTWLLTLGSFIAALAVYKWSKSGHPSIR
jgi:uncharacterized membrane protein YpjA